jgi:hypothetical protein
MPSVVVGGVVLRNEALNWTPCVRSLIQLPLPKSPCQFGPEDLNGADDPKISHVPIANGMNSAPL